MFLYIYMVAGIVCYILAVGLMLANIQRQFPTLASRDYIRDLLFSCYLSSFALLVPPLIIMYYFITGFAEYGGTLSRPKNAKEI